MVNIVDSVSRFVDRRCTDRKPSGRNHEATPCAEAYQVYLEFCRYYKLKPVSREGFGRQLLASLPKVKHKRARKGKQLFYVYDKLQFRLNDLDINMM